MMSEQFNLTVTDFELEEMSLNKDSVSQLKAAFLYFVKRNVVSFSFKFFPRKFIFYIFNFLFLYF